MVLVRGRVIKFHRDAFCGLFPRDMDGLENECLGRRGSHLRYSAYVSALWIGTGEETYRYGVRSFSPPQLSWAVTRTHFSLRAHSPATFFAVAESWNTRVTLELLQETVERRESSSSKARIGVSACALRVRPAW